VALQRSVADGNVCLAVWDADGRCTGWNGHGTVLHGCDQRPGHDDEHRCRCGSVCARGRDKIFPRYSEFGEVV
jgi:hypothetical protein